MLMIPFILHSKIGKQIYSIKVRTAVNLGQRHTVITKGMREFWGEGNAVS